MCGIAGIYNFSRSQPVDKPSLMRMNDALIHRGPDEQGVYLDGKIGLAMRRLSIIDLSSGQQPMSNEDDTLWIVFNGEIYNFQPLREELLKKGHTFKTSSDTEVILHLYEEMGVDCVTRLRGMFAFSLWDKKKERLFIARDRLGKKPLVYSLSNGRLAWSSEIQSILTLPDISREMDPHSIDLFLGLNYIPSPYTAYKDIRKLPPAHYLILEKGNLRIERYWNLSVKDEVSDLSYEDAKKMIQEKLKEAVRLRMISDVPLGAFLSGGIDSSVVVALMSELSEKPIKTFSIGFDESAYSELPYAKAVADKYGTQHTEFFVRPNMVDVLPLLARHYGEPFGDSSALPTYFVSQETRKYVTVALNGDGGDENFAGYARYGLMKSLGILDPLPRSLLSMLGTAGQLIPQTKIFGALLRKGKKYLTEILRESNPNRYFRLVGVFNQQEKSKIYGGNFSAMVAERAAENYISTLFDAADKLDSIKKLLFVDFSSYLPECLMTKIDIASMANSLEARSPFLDHEFIESVYSLPTAWKLKGLSGSKWILKEAMKDTLPRGLMHRKKMGFGIPIHTWFRRELKDFWRDYVFSSGSFSKQFFQIKELEIIYEEHQSGQKDHGNRMWNLLMLELWNRNNSKTIIQP